MRKRVTIDKYAKHEKDLLVKVTELRSHFPDLHPDQRNAAPFAHDDVGDVLPILRSTLRHFSSSS